jgi:hypothetical protein
MDRGGKLQLALISPQPRRAIPVVHTQMAITTLDEGVDALFASF